MTEGITPMVGRRAEKAALTQRLSALQEGTGGTVLIEGEAGIGKSRLVAELLQGAKAVGVIGRLVGAGDAVEKSTPYHAWRPIFSQLFNLAEFSDDLEVRRTHVLTRLQSEPDDLRLAPLLNVVLPLDLPENELTEQMSGEVRADNTHELLIRLLPAAASEAPLLLVLEDAHWLDSASWALTALVSRDVQPTLIVIATRPLEDPLPAEYRQLLQDSDTQQLTLDALPEEDTLALVCQRLGATALAEPVAALIREKAQGNPFFSEELAYALRDAGLLKIADGECQIAPDAGDPSTNSRLTLSATNLPDTVQGVITSRIDRLTPSQQLTLKVASVIGRVFAFRILGDIHPIEADRPQLPAYLDTLQRLDITPLETPPPDLAYLFKHIITQEVAYNLMLFEQRRELHRAVAEWYEHAHAEDLSPFYPLLAHHWSKAEIAEKAIDYLEKAGEDAMRGYANREAVRFFSEALALDAHLEPRSDGLRRAHWERQLGEAHCSLGRMTESREHLERAAALLGRPMPSTRVRLIASLLMGVLTQVIHRLLPASKVRRKKEGLATLLEAVRTYERFGQIYYYANKPILVIHTSVRGLNLAEAAGPSPELARIYSNMCIAAGLLPLRPLAEVYSERAWEIAQSVKDLPAYAWVFLVTSVYNLSIGQWAKAREALEQVIEIADRLGDRRRWDEGLGLQALVGYYQGEFAPTTELWADVYASARRRGDPQPQFWSLCGRAENGLPLGKVDEAMTFLEAGEALLGENLGLEEEIRLYGLLALARLRRGEPSLARRAAEKAAHLIAQSLPTACHTLEGYASVAEVYLSLWEASTEQPLAERKALQKSARQACKALRKFAWVFPIAQPRAWLFLGLYHWQAGKRRQVHRAWRKSLATAERLDMPYERGLAHDQIGRHLEKQDSARGKHLDRACEIFNQLGAGYDLVRTQAALETS